jgi:endoglucanase
LALLKRLLEARGVSGYENSIRDLAMNELKNYVDNVDVDNLGSVIGVKKGLADKPAILMIAAHMDEIGLLVKHIDEKGFLYFEKVGSVHERFLFAQAATVHTEKGQLEGIIFSEPFDTPEEQERKVPDLKSFYMDLGAKSRAEVEHLGVRIGDPITIERPFRTLAGKNTIASRAFDDRVGMCVLIEAMKQLKNEQLPLSIYVVFTTQEEVGLRGSHVAASKIAPQMAIAVDVMPARDTPGFKEKEYITRLGRGPTITIMESIPDTPIGLLTHPKVRRMLVETAEAEGIPYQREVSAAGTNDAAAIQLTGEGVPSGAITIPTRYTHAYELLDTSDVVDSVRLLVASLRRAHNYL